MNGLDVWSYRIPTGLFIKIFGIPFFAAGYFIFQKGLLISEDANVLPSAVIKLGVLPSVRSLPCLCFVAWFS